MKDFLMFRSFVAHTLVKVFFYIVLGVLFLGTAAMPVVMLIQEGFMPALGAAIVGLIIFVLYAILLRVSCEMMIVIFQIHDELGGIKSALESQGSSTQASSAPSGGQRQRTSQPNHL